MPEKAEKKFQTAKRSSSRQRIGESAPPPNSSRSRTPQARSNSKINKPLKKASTSAGLPPAKSPAAVKKSRATTPVTRARQPAPTRPQKTYRPIEGGKLKLQALAWTDDVARRMAVINDRIVHEGDSVDGYQVLKIRKDDVIVKENGKSWSLAFGLKQ